MSKEIVRNEVFIKKLVISNNQITNLNKQTLKYYNITTLDLVPKKISEYEPLVINNDYAINKKYPHVIRKKSNHKIVKECSHPDGLTM